MVDKEWQQDLTALDKKMENMNRQVKQQKEKEDQERNALVERINLERKLVVTNESLNL